MLQKSSKKAAGMEGSAKGQAFNHVLPMNRSWDEALDAIHYLLLKKWYYVAVATNTKRGGKVIKNHLGLERKRRALPEGMESILKLKMNSFQGLKKKIREKQLKNGEDRDVWHFSSQWAEFPEGTKVIELTQTQLSKVITGDSGGKTAYVIIDGKANTIDINTSMMIINKIYKNKEYTAKILGEVKKMKNSAKAEPTLTRHIDTSNARQPGTVLILLRDHPHQVNNVSPGERQLMDGYFETLKGRGQYTEMHKQIDQLLRLHFGNQ